MGICLSDLKKLFLVASIFLILAVSSRQYFKFKTKNINLTSDSHSGAFLDQNDLQQLEEFDLNQGQETEKKINATPSYLVSVSSEEVEELYCVHEDTPERIKYQLILNDLELSLSDTQDLEISEVETIRTKIAAIKDALEIEKLPNEGITLEDLAILELTKITLENFMILKDREKENLYTAYGGRQWLKSYYVKSYFEGQNVEMLSAEEVNHNAIEENNRAPAFFNLEVTPVEWK